MRRTIFQTLLFVLLACQSIPADQPRSERKPNVILILADDLGWSDTTLYDTTQLYETPNIERLASRGMTFTRAYADSPLCSPTRCAILTGLSPARTGLTAPNCHLRQVVMKAAPGTKAAPKHKSVPVKSVTRLDPKYYTLGESLQDAGYVTGHFGKWHLGSEPYSALEHGFNVDIPHWHGPGPAGGFMAPWKYVDFDPATPNEHIEDRMAQEAVAFMTAHRDQPFFLNYWMFSVHAPFDAKPELIEKYKSKVKPDEAQRSPTYAAMVESMDDAVGTLLDAVDRLKIADNTIVIFASDNGGNMYNWIDNTTPTSNAPLRGGKATMYEGGIRSPCTVVWPGRVEAGSRCDQIIQTSDFYPTILDFLKIDPQADQKFDGISILPALQGKPLNRDAIFTYFPHCPGVPDWLPPAVSVHRGDWKLIRLFQSGENGQHRWKLFNLAEDVGETTNLADKLPELVRELDALIETFLHDTQAVTPTPNPAFDPAQYDLASEGQAKPKGQPPSPAKPNDQKKDVQPTVAGWQARGHATLSIEDGNLVITSRGIDPLIIYDFEKPLPAGELTLKLTFSSDSKGRGEIFWAHKLSRPKFAAKRRVEFAVQHNGKLNEYSVKLPSSNPVTAIRLDLAKSTGRMAIQAGEIFDESGNSLYRWHFNE